MVELLAIEKQRLLATNGIVTRTDFEVAWHRSWETMKVEHYWPHATLHRRSWRRAQKRTRREMRAAFLDEPTPFSFAAARITEAAANMCLHLEPEQVGRALLAAMSYVEIEDEDTAWRASNAANVFVSMPQVEGESLTA